jgi:hypothetical protein
MHDLNSVLLEGTVEAGIYTKSFWLRTEASDPNNDEEPAFFGIRVLHSLDIVLSAGQRVRVVGSLTYDAACMQTAIKAEHIDKKPPFTPEPSSESAPEDLFA